MTDWFAVSIRWLFLLGLVTSLSLGRQLLGLVNLLLIGLVCWNIGLTLLTGLNRRLVYHREISLAVDLGVAGAYFALAGGFGSPAFWIVFLPLMTSTLYFEMVGAVISAILMVGVQVAVTIIQTRDPVALIFLIISCVFTIALAGLFGYLNVQLIRTNRKNRQAQQEVLLGAQQKKLGMENERLRAVYSLTSTLLGTLNYQRVLESVLDLSLSALTTESESGTEIV